MRTVTFLAALAAASVLSLASAQADEAYKPLFPVIDAPGQRLAPPPKVRPGNGTGGKTDIEAHRKRHSLRLPEQANPRAGEKAPFGQVPSGEVESGEVASGSLMAQQVVCEAPEGNPWPFDLLRFKHIQNQAELPVGTPYRGGRIPTSGAAKNTIEWGMTRWKDISDVDWAQTANYSNAQVIVFGSTDVDALGGNIDAVVFGYNGRSHLVLGSRYAGLSASPPANSTDRQGAIHEVGHVVLFGDMETLAPQLAAQGLTLQDCLNFVYGSTGMWSDWNLNDTEAGVPLNNVPKNGVAYSDRLKMQAKYDQ